MVKRLRNRRNPVNENLEYPDLEYYFEYSLATQLIAKKNLIDRNGLQFEVCRWGTPKVLNQRSKNYKVLNAYIMCIL